MDGNAVKRGIGKKPLLDMSRRPVLILSGMVFAAWLLYSISLGTAHVFRFASTNLSFRDSTGGAQIITHQDANLLHVTGVFINKDEGVLDTLDYRLGVRRSGESGTAHTRQSGTFTTAPRQVDTLSTVRVSIQTGDRISIHLQIYENTRLIGLARIKRRIE